MDHNKDNRNGNLHYLSELSDYTVSDDDKDVRGWEVRDASGGKIGTVDDLLVNKDIERVVYLDVEADESILDNDSEIYDDPASGPHEYINEDGEKHLIIPIGMAHLDQENEWVTTTDIDRDTFARTKRIKKGSSIDRTYETGVIETYTGSSYDDDDDAFYEQSVFERRDRDRT